MCLEKAKKDDKLSPKYYGPYNLFQNIGIMVPNFHVSCLKNVIGDKLRVKTILSELDEEGKIILEPKVVMETRTQQLQNPSISEYIIKWKNLPAKYSTWEDENFIQKHP